MSDQVQSNKPQQPLSAEDKLSLGLKGSPERDEPTGLQLSANEQVFPAEEQSQLKNIYKQIDAAFTQAGVKVTRDDPEWKYIQAELDDPNGSITEVLIAAELAAEDKAERLKKSPKSGIDKISLGLKEAKWKVPGKST